MRTQLPFILLALGVLSLITTGAINDPELGPRRMEAIAFLKGMFLAFMASEALVILLN